MRGRVGRGPPTAVKPDMLYPIRGAAPRCPHSIVCGLPGARYHWGTPMGLNYDRVMAFHPGALDASYTSRDCIIYALGIGIGMEPTDTHQLRFVYEPDLAAFPTMATVLGWPGRMNDPAFGIDERMLVAAELSLVLHRPLAPQARLLAHARMREVIDRGPGNHAILQATRDLVAPDGTLVATVDSAALARNHGGFGGPVTQAPKPHAVPVTAPALVCDLPTPPNLALIYRLTGDENPLHADPARASAAGFPRPILHGAATFGVAAHAIMRQYGYAVERLTRIAARFVRPVFPGDTIRTEMWPDAGADGTRISFQCRAIGRDEVVVSNGLATLRD
jgi:acyl dehydratase